MWNIDYNRMEGVKWVWNVPFSNVQPKFANYFRWKETKIAKRRNERSSSECTRQRLEMWFCMIIMNWWSVVWCTQFPTEWHLLEMSIRSSLFSCLSQTSTFNESSPSNAHLKSLWPVILYYHYVTPNVNPLLSFSSFNHSYKEWKRGGIKGRRRKPRNSQQRSLWTRLQPQQCTKEWYGIRLSRKDEEQEQKEVYKST